MNAAKLRILQTLYSIYGSHSLDVAGVDPRSARLAWASATIGRTVRSFNDLKDSETDALIDALKTLTGQPVQENPERWTRPRDRYTAKAFGTHGRRGPRGNDEVLASPGDLAAITEMYQRLGLTREQFDAWLTGPTSPLAKKSSDGTPALRTWRQCNRVRWALKQMLKRAGLWREGRAA